MGSSLLLKGGTSTPKSIVETITASHSFAVGDVVRYDVATSLWSKSQANSAENSEVAGVVSTVTATSFDVTYSGYISIGSLAGITSPVLFLDSTAAGGLTASPPSAIGMVVKPVLTKTTNGSGYIVSNYLGTQIGGSSTVAIDEIQPVGTVVPFAGSVIPDSWLECNGASYAVSAYPNLYAKLQYSGGDRAPAYGYVANIVVGNSLLYAVGQVVSQTATGLSGTVLATTTLGSSNTNTLTVQVIPTYSSNTKNFVQPNAVFSNAAVTIGSISSSISAVSVTHFNTPDLRGRFAIGANTSRLPTINDLESDGTNNSAISGIYSIGSEGGEEKNSLPAVSVATSGSSGNVLANVSGDLLNNMPPYTVVRYIIKATPYTRAAIIDGIDIPYTSLLVGDLRDGSLRPGGSGEALVFKTNDGTSGVERMRLTNTDTTTVALGSVLIGTNSPTSTYNNNYRLLEIAQTNGSGGSSVVTRGSTITLESGVAETVGAIIGTRTTSPLVFRTSTIERMRIDSNGLVNIGSTTPSTSKTTGGLTLGGGLGVGGAIYAGGLQANTVTASDATASTSTTTGSLIVSGGAGIVGALHVGGITTAGGITMGGALTVGGAAKITNATASTTTTSGALTVVGGVGIAGALHVGGGISAVGITLGSAQLAVPSGTAPIFGARAYGGAVFTSVSALTTVTGSKNITATYVNSLQVRFTFTTAMPDTNYVVMATGCNNTNAFNIKTLSKTVTSFIVEVVQRSDNSPVFQTGFIIDVVVFA